MTGSSSFWMSNVDSSFYNGVSTKSLKFTQHSTGSDNERLTRTMGTVDSATDFSINFWVKRSDLLNSRNTSYPMTLFTFRDGTSGSALNEIQFGEAASWGDGFTLAITHTNTGARILATTNLFRDLTAWYNIHIRGDLDNGTAAEKLKIYINNVEATYATDNRSSYSEMTGFKAGAWTIGDYYNYGYSPACLLALFTYTDGHKYLPTAFCEVKEGALIPKDPSVTYGNGGFRLAFASGTGVGTASSTTVGADTSGNDNHWTTTNIAARNVLPDNPENNFAILLPERSGENKSSQTFSEGNLQWTSSAYGYNSTGSSMNIPTTGKWYFECYVKTAGSTTSHDFGVGIQGVKFDSMSKTDPATATYGDSTLYITRNDFGSRIEKNLGNVYIGTSGSASTVNFVADDIISVCFDADSGKVFWGKNNVFWDDDVSTDGNPSAGTNETLSLTTGVEYFFTLQQYSNAYVSVSNFGQDSSFAGNKTAQGNTDANGIGDFYYAVPTDYLALCSANLPEPTISPNAITQPADHFNPYSYTADNTDNKSRSGMGFQPDLLWFKDRTTAFSNTIYDSSRGANKYIQSNNANAENTGSDLMSSFNSDGFTTQTDGSSGNLLNYSTDKYIAWSWHANGGTTTTNDASATGVGTIDSVYQANTTAGFSIITYTGTGSEGTVAHGLSSAPEVVFIKNRTDGRSWVVGHTVSGFTGQYTLNTTGAFSTNAGSFNDTAPTSTVVNVNTDQTTNESGDSMVMYCWHSVEGYSKFGRYTGNGSADGTYIHLGFKPAFFMAKSTGTENWIVLDNARPGYNPTGNYIYWNLSNAEGGAGGEYIDLLSNGVKFRTTGASANGSANFIYMAFAEMPQKYSNAR